MHVAALKHLSELLEPCAPEEFLASSWGRGFKHVRGCAGKFSALMPWPRLNDILTRHRLEPPRLRLMRDGKPVAVADYIRHTAGGAKRKVSIPRLRADELTDQLRAGATLIIDAVDELHEPLTRLAAALELAFRERVQINLYAGWRTSHGFDLHWDEHDVFILQVAGRKRWRVYGETRPAPVSNDIEPAPRPTDPLWEDTLEDGDLLYIPRGWWHVAFPLDEPTLHLTVGIHKRNGLDLARRLTDGLRASEAFRRDLPRDASDEEQSAHVARLRGELLARFDDDALASFFREQDESAEPRPRLSLPSSATPTLSPPPLETVVRLTAPRPISFDVRGDELSFACNRKRWRFDARALTVLRPLDERRVCAVAELCEAARDTLDERTVRALVGELILHGLVAIVDE